MDEDELDRELDNENAILNENDQEDAHFVEEIAEAIADPVVAPDAVADLGIAEPDEVVNPASRNSGVGTTFRRQIQVEEEGELSDDDDHAGSVLNSTTHRDVDESDGDDSEGGGGGNLQEAAHGLENLPGFSRHIMGQGLVGIPAVFATGNSGYWLPFTTEGPFGENNRVAPVRVETIFVPIGFIAKDASCIGEWETQSDPSARESSRAWAWVAARPKGPCFHQRHQPLPCTLGAAQSCRARAGPPASGLPQRPALSHVAQVHVPPQWHAGRPLCSRRHVDLPLESGGCEHSDQRVHAVG